MGAGSRAPFEFVRGATSGLLIPAHADALCAAGADFLTRAFRAYGVLAADNAVTAIREALPCHAGNSGHKLLLSVGYARPEPGLHTELFVKFSRDFADPFRDRRRHELESEIRLAALSRLPAFPVPVATPCFGDFDPETGTGLLITRRIVFGAGNIEPLRHKCMDHELADPLAYYRATVTALARLVAAHKSGRLSPSLEALFPCDLQAVAADLPIPWDEQGLRAAVARYADFAVRCPQLLPVNLTEPRFIARLEDEAIRFLRHEPAIRRFLYGNTDFIALAHWNTNIDNAWFFREADGALRCGLLDWGMVRHLHVATALWGGLSAAGRDMLEAHLDELIGLFLHEVAVQGGPRLDRMEFDLHFDLAVAMVGLALMMNVAELVLTRLPEVVAASGPHDPLLGRDEVARGFLHVFTNFLDLWERRDFGSSLERALGRIGGGRGAHP